MSEVTLSRAGILSFMDDESRALLAGYGDLITTQPGQVLIKEGDVNTHLYMVLDGKFNITTSALGNPVHLDTVGKSDCIGEVAIFHPDRASATVTCLQAARLWRIDVTGLQQFLSDWPTAGCAVILGLNILLSRRLRRANAVIRFNEIVPGFLSVRVKARETARLPIP